MLTGNKGEWSEIYVLLRILADKELFAGNSNLQRLAAVTYPIIRVIKIEKDNEFHFSYLHENVIIEVNDKNFSIPIDSFLSASKELFEEISLSKGTFSVPSIEEFLNSFGSEILKAKNSSKSDIIIQIHDFRTNQQPTLGFSIKSELGQKSTLLNASQATNFKYEIQGIIISDEDVIRINKIEGRLKIRKRIIEIEKLKGTLSFFKVNQSIFKNNLILIDSLLPEIVAACLIFYNQGKAKSIKEAIQMLRQSNPLNFDSVSEYNFYEYKIKRLLSEAALGMLPGTVWTGQYDATGGYLIVKKEGDIDCYHIFNKNEFEQYLFQNTKFETPSSTRNKFGTIYTENGKQFINLNLQIRFI